MLDLYHQFSNRIGKNMDVERLELEREKTEDRIMRYLVRTRRIISRSANTAGGHCRSGMNSGYATSVLLRAGTGKEEADESDGKDPAGFL